MTIIMRRMKSDELICKSDSFESLPVPYKNYAAVIDASKDFDVKGIGYRVMLTSAHRFYFIQDEL